MSVTTKLRRKQKTEIIEHQDGRIVGFVRHAFRPVPVELSFRESLLAAPWLLVVFAGFTWEMLLIWVSMVMMAYTWEEYSPKLREQIFPKLTSSFQRVKEAF